MSQDIGSIFRINRSAEFRGGESINSGHFPSGARG
jgi:hypothetical protein